MCGIVGYAGRRDALPILLDGLKRLEYRGSAGGGAQIGGGGVRVGKEKASSATREAHPPPMKGSTGLAHTRWATHGAPSKINAHPHVDCTGKIALAHNGIIENYASLREKLEARGHTFTSQTDTESLVHLIESYYEGDLEVAIRKALHDIRGSYAILAVHADEPGKVIGARNESPLVIGIGPDENFLASDVPALLRYTDRVVYVMDKEMVVITPKGVTLKDLEGNAMSREPQRITWSLEDAEKGGFEHFMLKEIHEAPQAIHQTLLGRLANLDLDGFSSEGITSVKLVACGTSYHAALVGKYVFEEIARIPASAELASEYRYSQAPSERPLVILISQSGEAADTLGAAREARRRGCKALGITNVLGSSLTREVDKTIYTRAGIEIGVAATKTFIAQLVALYLVALKMGQDRGTLGYDELDRLKDQLRSLPRAAQYVLNKAQEIEALAAKYGTARDMFYIGRHVNYPVAMEGALKIKEISYIHAEAYAAGELKHGPLALLTSSTPVVAVAVQDPTYAKMRSNIGEVSARGAPVLAVGTEGDKELAKFVDDVIEVPEIPWIFSPIPVSVALQLFAYEVARMHGCPIDKPRNLAKSVTVECGVAPLELNRTEEVLFGLPCNSHVPSGRSGQDSGFRREQMGGDVPGHRVKRPVAAVVVRSSGCDPDDPEDRLARNGVEIVATLVREGGRRHDRPHEGVVIVAADVREDEPGTSRLRRWNHGNGTHEDQRNETEPLDRHTFLQSGDGAWARSSFFRISPEFHQNCPAGSNDRQARGHA